MVYGQEGERGGTMVFLSHFARRNSYNVRINFQHRKKRNALKKSTVNTRYAQKYSETPKKKECTRPYITTLVSVRRCRADSQSHSRSVGARTNESAATPRKTTWLASVALAGTAGAVKNSLKLTERK